MVNLRREGGPGTGLFFEKTFARAWNRTGATLTAGELVMFDIGKIDIDTTTTLTEGADGSIFANVITPLTAGIGGLSGGAISGLAYMFGVVIAECDTIVGGGADNTKVYLQVQGLVKINQLAAASAIGTPLYPVTAIRTISPTVTVGNRPVAIAWEANSVPAVGSFLALFDGINGFPAGSAAS